MDREIRFENQNQLLADDKIKDTKFIIIGAGAIGSFYAMTLSKMGARNILVYDNDTIEDHNISNQIYPEKFIGIKKVKALLSVCLDYSGTTIETIEDRWRPDNAQDGDVIVVAVDDMDARKAIWNHYKTRPIKFFLEGRMGAQVYMVYGVDPTDPKQIAFYETKLYPQAEASPEPCGQKSIIYTVLLIAGEMLSMTKRFLMDDHRPTEVNYDALNSNIITTFHKELIPAHIEMEEEPEQEAIA